MSLNSCWRIERGPRIVFGQGLLRRTDDPDLAVTERLEVLGQAVEVENQIGPGANVLPDLVDDEDDVFLARRLAGNVEHFLDTVVLENDDIAQTQS